MSEEIRQRKLAAARKKLKEYQRKINPGIPAGATKKTPIKTGGSPQTTTPGGCRPPEEAPKDHTASASPAIDDILSPGRVPSPGPIVPDAPNLMDKRKSFSTENLGQLSENINGIVSESPSDINGEGLPFYDTTKDLEKHQNQDTPEKEKAARPDKLTEEQRAVREQLQVLIRTVSDLRSEKADLKTALAHSQKVARQKSGECEDLAAHLLSSQHRVQELERSLSAVSTQQKEAERLNQEMIQERDALRLELCRNTTNNEGLKQQNADLEGRLCVLLAEKAAMQQGVGELQRTLELSELLLQQFSSQSAAPDKNQQAAEERAQLESLPPDPPAGPCEQEKLPPAETAQLQKELENLAGQLPAPVQETNRLTQEQEERLLELEQAAQLWGQQAEELRQLLESMRNERTTISLALSQNCKLKEQLAELQHGFVNLANENMEMTSARLSEQHVKKELAKQLGHLQEKLRDLEAAMERKSQEAQGLQQQRDQHLSHLQQYVAAYQHLAACQQLASEKETLQKMDQVQHEELQGKVAHQEVQKTQELLEATSQNQQGQDQLSLLVRPGDGEGKEEEEEEKEEEEEEKESPTTLTIPEVVEALTTAEEEKARLRLQLRRHQAWYRRLAREAAPPHSGPARQTLIPRSEDRHNSLEHHLLGTKPCVPFFYHAAFADEIKILFV